MSVEIIPYQDHHWPELREFLHHNWQENHPLCHRELFDWQYRGFDVAEGRSMSRVAVVDGRIAGFLGAIPGKYVVGDRGDRGDKIVTGVAMALWVVEKRYLNSGLGILLMREVEAEAELVVCLGMNPKTIRYYTTTGYTFLPALHRYVVPLDAAGYSQLLAQPIARDEINNWIDAKKQLAGRAIEPQTLSAAELFSLWRQVAQKRWTLSLCRTEAFWTWRYLESAGFDYLFFAGPDGRGLIVARLEKIASADQPQIDGMAVLRIIELLGEGPEAAELVTGVLTWARQQGAIAADFQSSSTRFEKLLTPIGFYERTSENHATQLPELFNPVRHNAAPINLALKAKQFTISDFDETYFVKSDGDMDRPNR